MYQKIINDTGILPMRFFAYFACANTDGAREVRQHFTFQEIREFFTVPSENVVIEIVDIKQPFADQRLLKELIREKMNRGDTIVITDLESISIGDKNSTQKSKF